MSSPRAFISCSPSGRVGASTTARILVDYFAFTGRPSLPFDTDLHERPMALRFGDAEPIDVASVLGQMALFDRMLADDGLLKIVDVSSRCYDAFFTVAEKIGFFDEAHARGVVIFVLFHVDGSDSSIRAARRIAAVWPSIELVIVENHGASGQGELDSEIIDLYPAGNSVLVRALDPVLRRVVEDPDFSLFEFMIEPPENMSIVVRAALRAWIGPVFDQLKVLELRIALRGSFF
jgi:hypothetical protein